MLCCSDHVCSSLCCTAFRLTPAVGPRASPVRYTWYVRTWQVKCVRSVGGMYDLSTVGSEVYRLIFGAQPIGYSTSLLRCSWQSQHLANSPGGIDPNTQRILRLLYIPGYAAKQECVVFSYEPQEAFLTKRCACSAQRLAIQGRPELI